MAKSKKDKRKQKLRQARRQKIARVQRQAPAGEAAAVPPGRQVSMSAALIDFLNLESEPCDDEKNLRKMLSLGMIAWNAAILPAAQRSGIIEDTVAGFPPDARVEARYWLDSLINRKESLFADNQRMMLNYAVTMTSEGPHIVVMSTVNMP